MKIIEETEENILRVAKAIEGPRNEVPANSGYQLQHLREIRWEMLSNSERGSRRLEAVSAIKEINKMLRE